MFAVAWATMNTEASATRRALIRPTPAARVCYTTGGATHRGVGIVYANAAVPARRVRKNVDRNGSEDQSGPALGLLKALPLTEWDGMRPVRDLASATNETGSSGVEDRCR